LGLLTSKKKSKPIGRQEKKKGGAKGNSRAPTGAENTERKSSLRTTARGMEKKGRITPTTKKYLSALFFLPKGKEVPYVRRYRLNEKKISGGKRASRSEKEKESEGAATSLSRPESEISKKEGQSSPNRRAMRASCTKSKQSQG